MYDAVDVAALAAAVAAGPTPLFATVSGAHLYGFASADSDVDVRGAFVLSLAARVRLVDPTETLTVSRDVDGVDLDWVAHDVRKFARLMTRRNGYVLEQLYSPLIVVGDDDLDELRQIGRGCIVRHLVHHYRGFARTKRRELAKPGATVKDLLYLYRVYLTGVHVLTSGEVEAHLPTLLDAHPLPGVADLVARKRAGGEHVPLAADEWTEHEPLANRLENELEEAFATSSLPATPTSLDQLDDFVVRICLERGGG
jgi:predicted nucleotidyltransferase